MTEKVYNILWADDDCDTLVRNQEIRKGFYEANIEILEAVPSSMMLEQAIDRYYDKVDAVIVDANFSRTETCAQSNDFSGLMHTVQFISTKNQQRLIPFFLYTNKKVVVEDMFRNGEIKYFTDNDRIIQKGDVEKLTSSIINTVEHINSAYQYVKRRYRKELDTALQIDNKKADECTLDILNLDDEKTSSIHDLLYKLLISEELGKDYYDNQYKFNLLRLIIEKIQLLCETNQYIPNINFSLNDFKNYWKFSLLVKTPGFKYQSKVGTKESYTFYANIDVMPRALATMLEPCIDIIQDGSHAREDLKLKVNEYVASVQNPYLLRTCLYTVMDLLCWYSKLTKQDFERYFDVR